MDLKIILIFIPSKKKYMLISDVRMPTKFLLSFPEISKILFREIMLYLSSKVVSSHLTGSTTCGTAFLWKLNGILGFKFNISLGLPKKTGCPASRAIPAQNACDTSTGRQLPIFVLHCHGVSHAVVFWHFKYITMNNSEVSLQGGKM